jgi:4a-hydroxytetrahydrobiopterin dehydratase
MQFDRINLISQIASVMTDLESMAEFYCDPLGYSEERRRIGGADYDVYGMEPALHFEDPEGDWSELTGTAIGTAEDLPGLASERCEACRADAPQVTAREIEEFSRMIPEWKIVEREGVNRLERDFRFPDFWEALAFANCVAEAAEREGHHPEILTRWGGVTVTWWSHKIKGLHRNDFIMAAKTDAIVG